MTALKAEITRLSFTSDMIRFVNIYVPIKFYQESHEQYTFVLTFDPGKVFYSEGLDMLRMYVYDSPKHGPQLRIKSLVRPAVFTPDRPAAWLASMINILDAQNRKRDDIFKCAESIEVAVRSWSTIARFGPHQGEMITGLNIDHVNLHGLKPEKLES